LADAYEAAKGCGTLAVPSWPSATGFAAIDSHGGLAQVELQPSIATSATFGDLLREARRQTGLTQAKLAERAGLSVRTVEHLEAGRGHPFAHSAAQLADALGLASDVRADFLAAARPVPRAPAARRHDSTASPRMNPRNKLPVALTTFVGRERELVELNQLMGASRLLTLTGPGGIGKTRLAIEAVGGFSHPYVDEICWIELGPLLDGSLVAQAVASGLGVLEQSGRPPLEVLADALCMRRLLLVLDNCEHLAAACAALADVLLRSCPDLRIVATSRQPLALAGETIWRVPALSMAEATQLFVERARALEPGWAPTQRNASAVAQVCDRLDGIPLAIEFAAARLTVLAPEQIAARLTDRLSLLTIGSRSSPPRHQTLRATLDWSYGLLAPDEQLLFDRLSVFAGGWSLEAAESVGAADRIQPRVVLDLLTRLVDQSLVIAVHGEHSPVRYRFLETLREYAAERLADTGAAEAVQERHAAFFLALAERNEPELFGTGWMAAQASFERERDNIRAALRWLVTGRDAERAQRLAGSLARFWFFRGYFDEGSAWLGQVLALSETARSAGRAKSLHGAGTIAMMRGDFPAAKSALREALRLWQEQGDGAQQGFVLFVLGMVARQRGEYAEAGRSFEEGLETSRAAGSAPAETNNLAGLADVAREQGRLGEARGYAEDALKCASAAGYARGMVHALRALGEITYEMGDYVAATHQLEAGLVTSRELGAHWLVAWTLARLGLLAIERRDFSAAEALLTESVSLCRDMGDRQGIARALEGFGQLASLKGSLETALRLVGAAARIRTAIDVPLSAAERTRLEQRLAPVRAKLGESASEAACAAGRELSLQQAMALAAMPVPAGC
jgi:predicted ATPase/DNA-binding XRE family transcriptional regulator